MSSSQNYIHLSPLSCNDLPPNEALGNTSSTAQLQSLLDAILTQASSFLDTDLNSFTRTSLSESKPSTSQVEVLSQDRDKKTWFARRSKHNSAITSGSADWAEFDSALRVQHVLRQKEYTPEILDAFEVCAFDGRDLKVQGWREITCQVYEVVHKASFPLHSRSFSVLSVTATSTEMTQSLMVQIPVDLKSAPGARYAFGRNKQLKQLPSELQKETVPGDYLRLERISLEGEAGSDRPATVQWEMVTAIDAKGNVPLSLQKMGTPSLVTKEVGSVIAWLYKKRIASMGGPSNHSQFIGGEPGFIVPNSGSVGLGSSFGFAAC